MSSPAASAAAARRAQILAAGARRIALVKGEARDLGEAAAAAESPAAAAAAGTPAAPAGLPPAAAALEAPALAASAPTPPAPATSTSTSTSPSTSTSAAAAAAEQPPPPPAPPASTPPAEAKASESADGLRRRATAAAAAAPPPAPPAETEPEPGAVIPAAAPSPRASGAVLEAERALRRRRRVELAQAWLLALLPPLLGLVLAVAWWRCGLLPAARSGGAGAGGGIDLEALRSAAAQTLGGSTLLDASLEEEDEEGISSGKVGWSGADAARMRVMQPADAWAAAVCSAASSRRALPLGLPLLLVLLLAGRLGLTALGAALQRLVAAPASSTAKSLVAAAEAAPAGAATPAGGLMGMVGSALRVVPAAMGAYRATTAVCADLCVLLFVWLLASAAVQAMGAEGLAQS